MFKRKMSGELKSMAAQKPYVNLESLRTQELIEADPIGFLNNYPNGAILDEIQRLPKLLSEIQVRIDEAKIIGMFILTGSHQVGFRSAIAQSLAGRTSILHLLPISIEEFLEAQIPFSLDEMAAFQEFIKIN